jgi:hypothetical protein
MKRKKYVRELRKVLEKGTEPEQQRIYFDETISDEEHYWWNKINVANAIGREETIEWVKYRWEFVRRNPEYIRAYEEAQKLAEALKLPKTACSEEFSYKAQPSAESKSEYRQRTKELCEPLGVNRVDKDPRISFDQYFELWIEHGGKDTDDYYGAIEWFAMELGMWPPFNYQLEPSPDRFDRVTLSIDLTKVNSIDALRDYIADTIDWLWIEYQTRFKQKKKTRKLTDYDLILQVGDMKDKEGLTERAIAKVLFPRDYKIDNENANPETAERKVGQYYQKYKAIVNGGYRDFLAF